MPYMTGVKKVALQPDVRRRGSLEGCPLTQMPYDSCSRHISVRGGFANFRDLDPVGNGS
jgi:hypothetical protein